MFLQSYARNLFWGGVVKYNPLDNPPRARCGKWALFWSFSASKSSFPILAYTFECRTLLMHFWHVKTIAMRLVMSIYTNYTISSFNFYNFLKLHSTAWKWCYITKSINHSFSPKPWFAGKNHFRNNKRSFFLFGL